MQLLFQNSRVQEDSFHSARELSPMVVLKNKDNQLKDAMMYPVFFLLLSHIDVLMTRSIA